MACQDARKPFLLRQGFHCCITSPSFQNQASQYGPLVHGSQQQDFSSGNSSRTSYKVTRPITERWCATPMHFKDVPETAVRRISDGNQAGGDGKEEYINTVSPILILADNS